MCRVDEDGGEALRGGLVVLHRFDCVVMIVLGDLLFVEERRVGDGV